MTEKESTAEAEKQIGLIQKHAAQNRAMTAHRFFFGYAYELFTHAQLYTHWQNLLAYIRRFRMIAFVLRVLTIIWSILQTGALVLLTTALFLVILPIAAALMLGILLTALIESRRTNRQLREESEGKQIYVLFMTDRDNPFLSVNTKNLADSGNTVLIVSPYWISAKGIRRGHFYCTARKEADDVYLVRRYYFFSLKKHVLSDAKVGYVY